APLALLDFSLLGEKLFTQPLQHVLRRLPLEGEVLIDVLVDQCVDGERGKLRFLGLKGDVNKATAAYRLHRHARHESADERRLVGRLVGFGASAGAGGVVPPKRCARRSRITVSGVGAGGAVPLNSGTVSR